MTSPELDALIAEKVMGLGPAGWVIQRRLTMCRHFLEEGSWSLKKHPGIGEESHEDIKPRQKKPGQNMSIQDFMPSIVSQDYQEFGWLNCSNEEGPFTPVPCYSTDIAAVWEVVEMLTKDDDIVIKSTSGGWTVVFDQNPNPTYSFAKSLPHAICLAALKAVGIEV